MVFPGQNISFIAAIFLMLFSGSLSDTSPVCSVIQGLPGLNGRDGRDGIHGLKGDPGPPGEPGTPGIRGSFGPPGKEGPRGNTGLIGLPGHKGEKGAIGAQGLQGSKGEKGDNCGQSAHEISLMDERIMKLQLNLATLRKAFAFFIGLKQSGDKIYVSDGTKATYDVAKTICTSAGGQLASPQSDDENQSMLSLRAKYGVSAYLGITDMLTEGTFKYANGDSLVYTNWNKGEPNQAGEEDCVEMQDSGKWNDRNCEEQRLIICEFYSFNAS
ncbi:pulmonary surfactant-associated protein D-like [Phyllobates terribilis]|uniref:pulmonary surfactant-associated protein D-like n=1 Tax=Phyllobates terribilis TaxID=111132 RepID=UPI003CCB5CDB